MSEQHICCAGGEAGKVDYGEKHMNKEKQAKIKAEMDAMRAALKTFGEEELKGEAMRMFATVSRKKIEAVQASEQDAYEKMSDSQQCSSKGEALEETISILEEAMDVFDELLYAIDDDASSARDIKEIGYDIANCLQDLV